MPAAETWIAIRELHEGAPGSLVRLAAATGKLESTLRNKAEKDGWREYDPRRARREREERLRIMIEFLSKQAEEMVAGANGETVDKARIEAVSAMLKLVEKLQEITRGEDSAKEEQIATDEEIAGVLARINRRIVELAHDYARRLGADERDRTRGAADAA